MSREIFKEIKDAIKTRCPELLIFHGVDPKDFDHVMEGLRHPTNYLEQYSFRVHWFSADKILKVVMPSKLHVCAAGWLFESIQRGLARGVIPEIWVDTMDITPSPEYDNFMSPYRGSSKEADLTFVPRIRANWTTQAEFPSVVLESGWSEPAGQLHRDATLWQQGSGGEVRVVIQVKFFQLRDDRIGARLWISRANLDGGCTVREYGILPPVNDPDGSPTIAFREFFAGNCPPGIDPEGCIVLDLETLRVRAREEIRTRGCLPDE
ncbi:hypothetical protein HOY80DRAFT_1134946 [Tuber brumale]|nr:hypothetical protein HOY80DRAFT_1134946 [Tuber brumale]